MMADSQDPALDFNNPYLNLLDYGDYWGEQPAEPESTLSAPTLAPNNPRISSQDSSLEPHQERVSFSEAPTVSCFEDTAMVDTRYNPWGWPSSMPATDTGINPLHQHEQPSGTDNVTAEMNQIENELAEVKLKLEQHRLQKRHQELLKRLTARQPIQVPERPQVQNLEPAIGPSIEWRTGQEYNASINNCELDALQRPNLGMYSHYDVGSTNSSNLGFPDPLINPQEELFNLENLEHPEMINARLLDYETAQSLNSMPTLSADLEHNHEYGVQGSSPAFPTEHIPMRPSSVGPQYEQDLRNSTPLVSAMSSIQHGQHIQSPEKGLITQKRPRSPQPNMTDCLSALQRQAKKTGVPQSSLNVMRFNPEHRSKRPRTSSQKQNKKNVQDAGGSCFLCLFFKKRVSL